MAALTVSLKTHAILMCADEKWAVPENMAVKKLNKEWLLMLPTNYSLCKIIAGASFDRSKRYSLKNAAAFEDLLHQRNVKSNLVIEGKDSLFDNEGDDDDENAEDKKEVKKVKRRKIQAAEDAELRIDLPDGRGQVSILKASKIKESLAVEFSESNLSILFGYLHGTDLTSENARSYKASGKYAGVAAKRKDKVV